jgi:hypothetical protein
MTETELAERLDELNDLIADNKTDARAKTWRTERADVEFRLMLIDNARGRRRHEEIVRRVAAE